MKRITKAWIILGLISVVILASCRKIKLPQEEVDTLPNDIVLKWNVVAFEAEGGATYQHALLASRVNAMVHIAIHDALNAIVPLYEPYVYRPKFVMSAHPVAAAASAAHTVLLATFPQTQSMLDAELAASLSEVPDGELKEKGVALGIEAGNAILFLRQDDGAFQDPVSVIEPSTVPGVYNVVPPFNFIFGAFWKTMKPFSLERNDQFRSAPHPDLTSHEYATAFNEIKEVGELNSTTRTSDQSSYAKWWYELSEIGWNRVARIKSMEQKPGLYTTARLFALLNMGIADSYIAGWDSKFYYNFWRPYTAIRAAATDGNDETEADADWEPAEPTPPIQDYPSTHSSNGNTAATILKEFFHNEGFSMTSTTGVPASTVRSFDSFKEAADENADSRVMAGIHFRFACEAGQTMGNKIGKWTIKNHLQPRHFRRGW